MTKTIRVLLADDHPVVMLSAYDDGPSVRRLVAAGIAGYVLKDEAVETVARAIRTAMQGDTWFSRAVVEKLAVPETGETAATGGPALTGRELAVLRLVAAGNTDQQIGQKLHIAERTVRRWLREIYDKLGTDTRVEAAVRATRLGLVDDQGSKGVVPVSPGAWPDHATDVAQSGHKDGWKGHCVGSRDVLD